MASTAPGGTKGLLPGVPRQGRGGRAASGPELVAPPLPLTLPEGPGKGLIHLLLLLHFPNVFVLWQPGLWENVSEWLSERQAVADG